MAGVPVHAIDVVATFLTFLLIFHVPLSEMRVHDDYLSKTVHEEPPQTSSPEPLVTLTREGQGCFQMTREDCPNNGTFMCKKVGQFAVFCCDVDNFRLMEGLAAVGQNSTALHILNATVDVLDLSHTAFRRLTSMAVTDGNIRQISAESEQDDDEYDYSAFPRHSPLSCLNISNNNLTSAKLQTNKRPFRNLYNLTVLDVSSNNLTELPYALDKVNRNFSVDLSGNNYISCKEYQRAMDTNSSHLVSYIHYNKTFCKLSLIYSWFTDYEIVSLEHVRKQILLNENCLQIKPPNVCTCVVERVEKMVDGEARPMSSVDCSSKNLTQLPSNLPPNTIKLNVTNNKITSLEPVQDDPSYETVRQLIVDYNDIQTIIPVEGTKFIENFNVFSIQHNKLKTVHTYVFTNLERNQKLSLAGNSIHCDCNTEKVLKTWLFENQKNILDFRYLQCDNKMGPVADLQEYKVCNTSEKDWTEYIYWIIFLEVLALVTLISKVSYDYWVFKTAGYLPWPANKMPRLPCDWLCE